MTEWEEYEAGKWHAEAGIFYIFLSVKPNDCRWEIWTIDSESPHAHQHCRGCSATIEDAKTDAEAAALFMADRYK